MEFHIFPILYNMMKFRCPAILPSLHPAAPGHSRSRSPCPPRHPRTSLSPKGRAVARRSPALYGKNYYHRGLVDWKDLAARPRSSSSKRTTVMTLTPPSPGVSSSLANATALSCHPIKRPGITVIRSSESPLGLTALVGEIHGEWLTGQYRLPDHSLGKLRRFPGLRTDRRQPSGRHRQAGHPSYLSLDH